MSKSVSLWGPVAFWCLVIYYLSSIPDLSSGLRYDGVLRKLAHVVEFAVLFLLLRRALRGSFSLSRPALAWLSCLGTVLYAMSDEYHQAFVPGRNGCWLDVFIDGAGAAAGALLARHVQRG